MHRADASSIAHRTTVGYAAAMKYIFAALLLMLLAGCSSDEEDKAFYNSGWFQPEKGANERMMRGGHDTSPITSH